MNAAPAKTAWITVRYMSKPLLRSGAWTALHIFRRQPRAGKIYVLYAPPACLQKCNDTITARRNMNRLTLIFLLATAPAAFAASDWISLFNGKDFTGWKVGGDQNTFQVKDGALVANGQVAHACYDGPVNNHDFKNFELTVDVLTAPNSNRGGYFHTEFQDRGFPRQGFEVQVNNTHDDPVKTVSLYHLKDIGPEASKGITQEDASISKHFLLPNT